MVVNHENVKKLQHSLASLRVVSFSVTRLEYSGEKLHLLVAKFNRA